MITNNVIQRVFNINYDNSSGTCFTIEFDPKQYIITAKHIIKSIKDNDTIQIFHEKTWKNLNVKLVGHCPGDIDISVIKAEFKLSPDYILEPTSAGLMYGQDSYFLGFPYGMKGELGKMNADFPFPFVKKSIISLMEFNNGVEIIYLDGYNNPGFSGGPVVFKEPNKNDFKVASVVSGYKYVNDPIYHKDKELDLTYKYNTGIIETYGIKHANEIIKNNPIGFNLD